METRQKILIVDDKPQNLFSLRQVLSEIEAEIIEAASGNDALVASLNHEFALAILDVQMPEMNGYELAEFLRSEKKTETLPIIFVSAVYSSEYHVFKGYESGAVDFLVKPFDARILLSKVKVLLELKRRQADLKTAKERIECQYDELRASESRFESLVLTVPDIVYRIDTQGFFTFVNDAVKKLGYTPDELVGKHFGVVILPSEVDRVSRKSAVQKQRTRGEPCGTLKLFDERRTGKRKTTGLEICLIPKKGNSAMTGVLEQVGDESVVVEVNSAGLYSDRATAKDRIHLGTVGVIRDITDRKNMEDQLRRTNEELERRVSERTRMLTEKNRSLTEEIHKREQAEDTLRQAKREWQEIFEAIGHMVAVIGTDYKILAVNQSVLDLTGLPRSEIVGKGCHEIFHGTSQPFLECPMRGLSTSEKAKQSEVEVDVLGRACICSSTPVFGDDGELVKLIHVWTDITRRKTLEKELIHAHKMEAIGTLAGGIAHDFNNILSALLGFAELARHDAPENSILAEDLTEILNCGLRAKDLVRQILTFARQSEEKYSYIQLDYIVKEVIKFIRSTIPSLIEINTDIQSSSQILANPTQMHQVLMNLCTNASHAMAEKGGLLQVSLRDIEVDKNESDPAGGLAPGRYVELTVSDTGHGIAPSIMNKIFEPYFTTKEIGEGTGMGLAVTQGIVKEIKGRIDATSSPGKGSVFRILVPAVSGTGPLQKIGEAMELQQGYEHILFVDDEPPITKVGKRFLESSGYEVTLANDPEMALDLYRNAPESFDLVITDLTMPKMSGLDLVEEILTIRPDMPVIMCTGYTKKDLVKSKMKNRLNAFVRKPIEKDLLLRTVREVLDGA